MAACLVQANTGDAGAPGQKYCGFICKLPDADYTCPGSLTCGPTDEEGVAVCLPK
jgi:hypothetical protein